MNEIQLTRENFWNELLANYPGGMDNFSKWIDEYKRRVDWAHLFNSGRPNYADQGWHNPKFHDLPAGMQVGIFMQYTQETPCRYEYIEGQPRDSQSAAEMIRSYFQQNEKFFYGITELETNY